MTQSQFELMKNMIIFFVLPYIEALRQESKKLGTFLGKRNGETETESWTDWPGHLQPDTEGHRVESPRALAVG